MTMRRMLLVTYHFPPSAASGAFRMLGFARHLPKFGWRPVVVAPPKIPWEPTDPALAAQVPAETPWYPVPYRQGGLLQRLAPDSCWLPRAWRACRSAVAGERPELVLTSGPPHQVHLLGLALRRRYGLPWIADLRDPWITDGLGRPPRGARGALASRLERAVFHQADALIANAPGAAEALADHYPALRGRIVTIPNGYDPEAFDFPEAIATRAEHAPIRIIHTGAIYAGRDPRPFLDAIRALVHGPEPLARPIEVVFYGTKPEFDLNLAAEIERRGLTNHVRAGGQVSYARTLRELVAADVLLLLDTPGRRIGVPAKLYEYMGARRPILALGERDGDLARTLRESGATHRISPLTDADAIARALSELSKLPPESSPPSLKFTREALAGELAGLFDRCAAAAGTRAQERGSGRRDAVYT